MKPTEGEAKQRSWWTDELEVESVKDYLIKEKDAIIAVILGSRYHPNPVLRIEIPKDNGRKDS